MSERKLLFLMTAEQALAFAQLVKAAEAGSGHAACRLGDMCREGLGGLRFSPKATYRWYAKSALAGDANGQNNLGACYEHGLGCAQSYPKAAKWYRLSVAQGLGTAAMNLGYCYLWGHGVPRDKVEALRLFRLAVAAGEDRAASEVELLEESLRPRGLQLAPEIPRSDASRPEHSPADTQQARPCVLALGSVPRDGPPENLGAADVVAPEVCSAGARTGHDMQIVTPLDTVEAPPQPSNVRWIRGTRFVDETQNGTHLGLVGISGPQPPQSVAGDADLHSSAVVSARRAGAGGPLEDRLEAGIAESEPPRTD